MDREQEEMQFLGLFGIYKESYKILISWRKIFGRIALALILPLAFIFLAQIEISNLIVRKMFHLEFEVWESHPGTKIYNAASDLLTKERTYFWLFRVTYYIVVLIFSLLSTSAVVYTIASIYTGRDITFKKVMSIVPIVWKRLMITFLFMFLCVFIYHIIFTFVVVILFIAVIIYTNSSAYAPVTYIIIIIYFLGFLYITLIWQLASVISVLEESCGFRALIKSKNLIKGKIWIALFIFFKLIFTFIFLQVVFGRHVVRGNYFGWNYFERVIIGIFCLLVLMILILFGLVVQTIIYFVCKSYHHENIDKSVLSNHLEVIYLGDYLPLKSKDVQLEEYQV